MTSLRELSDAGFARLAEAEDLAAVERGLRCILMAKAREGAQDVLGPGLANDYIHRKEWEASRIRLLARRAAYHLPLASVEREVFC
jgi:V/A-type H+-transporting ATPase subunit C